MYVDVYYTYTEWHSKQTYKIMPVLCIGISGLISYKYEHIQAG